VSVPLDQAAVAIGLQGVALVYLDLQHLMYLKVVALVVLMQVVVMEEEQPEPALLLACKAQAAVAAVHQLETPQVVPV
jgi:hypothetical protein